MLSSIWKDVKAQSNQGSMLTRIIWVNVVGFLLLLLSKLIMGGMDDSDVYETFKHSLILGSDWKHNLTHPWVFITYMFLHEDLWHLLWNMLCLYWFGRIVGDLLGDHRVLPMYLLSGLAGGFVYFAVANIGGGELGFGSYAMGASAAIMGLLCIAGATAPNYKINLSVLGDVRLKFIVGFFLILDQNPFQAGVAHLAHAGGALFGLLLIGYLRKRGKWLYLCQHV